MQGTKLLFLFLMFVILNLTSHGQNQVNDKESTAFFEQGNRQFEAGNYLEAISDFHLAVKANPNSVKALNSICVSYSKLEKFSDALLYCQKSVAIKSDFSVGFYNLGRIYFELEQYREAVEAFNRALVLNPDYAEVYYHLGGISLIQEDFPKALEHFNNAIRIVPNDADYWLLKGRVLFKLNRLTESAESINKSIEIKAGERNHSNLGVVFVSLKKYDKALENFKKALSFNSESAEINYWVGYVYFKTKKEKLAIAQFEKAIALNPNYADAYHILGVVYLKNRKKDAAIDQYKKLRSINWEMASHLFKQIFADKLFNINN